MKDKSKKIHKQREYISNSKNIGHRDMCNDLAIGRFEEPVIIMDDKIMAYTVKW